MASGLIIDRAHIIRYNEAYVIICLQSLSERSVR
jgi:hypothetical protein